MLKEFYAQLLKTAKPVSVLQDPNERELLKSYDLICSHDTNTKKWRTLHGLEMMGAIAVGTETKSVMAMAYLCDSKADFRYLHETIKREFGAGKQEKIPNPPPKVSNTVRVYDLETKSLLVIPVSELAPGYVCGKVPGTAGIVYVKPKGVCPAVQPHQDMSEECKRVIQYYADITQEVDRRNFDQHVAGMLRERKLLSELFKLFCIANVYASFTKSKVIAKAARISLFQVLLHSSFAEPHTAMATLDLHELALSKQMIQAVIDAYFAPKVKIEYLMRFNLEKLYPL